MAGRRCHQLPFRNPRPLLTWRVSLFQSEESQLAALPEGVCPTYPEPFWAGGTPAHPPPHDSCWAPPPGMVLKNANQDQLTNLRDLNSNDRSRGAGSNGGCSHPQKSKRCGQLPAPCQRPPLPLRATVMPQPSVPISAYPKRGWSVACHTERLPTPALWENALVYHTAWQPCLPPPAPLPPQSHPVPPQSQPFNCQENGRERCGWSRY